MLLGILVVVACAAALGILIPKAMQKALDIRRANKASRSLRARIGAYTS